MNLNTTYICFVTQKKLKYKLNPTKDGDKDNVNLPCTNVFIMHCVCIMWMMCFKSSMSNPKGYADHLVKVS